MIWSATATRPGGARGLGRALAPPRAPDDNTGAVGGAVFLGVGAFFVLVGGYGAVLTLV